jgi:hypothetical protein
VVLGAIVAYRARPIVLYDDAANTMRYASRIASGDGWTYNDGDRTNGASAPLYTLILAFMDLVGFNIVTAARIVCSISFAASFGLVAYLGSRIAGMLGGALATVFLFSWFDYSTQALFGMESALAVALGLGVIVALREDNDTWAGVLLGLALFNKLDAGLLAAAVAVGYLAVLRRPPWRVAWISAAVVAPWFLFSTVYFGSPLPHSFTQKASDQVTNPSYVFDRTWMFDGIESQGLVWLVVLGLASLIAVPWLARTTPRAAVALAVCVAWPLFHGLAFSLVNLGDAYSWYFTALYPPIALAAACALGLAVKAAAARSQPLAIGVAGVALFVAVLVIGVASSGYGPLGTSARALVNGHTVSQYEGFEAARRDAGEFVGELAEPGDVIATCWGWIAFGARDNPIHETCPLNTSEPVGPPRYGTVGTFPGFEEPDLGGGTIVETFYSDVGEGGRIDVIEFGGFPD